MTVTETSILHVALAAHDAGLSVIPIRDDGSKKPALSWKQYQSVRADRQQVRAWFAPGRHRAIGVVCGEVSGWLTMLEMEGWAFRRDHWKAFKDEVEAKLGIDRWEEIVRYVELSPSRGPHIYFRCPGVEVRNIPLSYGQYEEGPTCFVHNSARVYQQDEDGTRIVFDYCQAVEAARGVNRPLDGECEWMGVKMETRGEGGYSVIAGSEGHESGRRWEAAQGSWDDVCEVTPDELEVILAAARNTDEGLRSPKVEADDVQASASLPAGTGEVPHSPVPTTTPSGTTTGTTTEWMDQTIQEFNDSVGVLGILSWLPGWTYVATENYKGESVHRLHRDGSDNDHGAMIFDSGRIAFFSSNCPAWADAYDGGTPKTYDAFSVMMHVDKGTNDATARVAVARELRAQGFGPPPFDVREHPNTERHSDETTVDPDTGQSEAEEPKSTLRWVEDALANPPDEPDVLVTGLLRRGEITVVGAPRAIGKTWASLNLASICANGTGEMFGSEQFRSITPARVLYLQGELGEWGSAARWQLLGGNMPPHMIAESFERIRIRTTERKVTDVADGTTMVDTYMEAVVDHRLEQLITEVSADVLVIDPWATFFAGNENSNDETEAAIITLTDIARRHNLAVWIVHHITNKGTMSASAEPEDMWRGASRLADAVATRVTMLPYWTPQRAKDIGLDRRTARGQIRVTVLERNGPPVDMVYSELRNHWWSDWEPPDIGRPAELSGKDVVRALEANGGRVDSQRALEAIVDKGHTAVKRVVDHLVGAGVVQTFTGPRNSIGYELTGRGLPE